MSNKAKKNWKKAQPHSAMSGKIMKRKYAESNPRRVEWVTSKKGR